MYHFEIEDTALNRQRAASKIFEGRAAALLEIDERHELVDKTLSEFTGGGRPAKPATQVPAVEVAAPVLDQTPSIPAEAEALRPFLAPAPEEPKPAILDLTPRSAEPSKAIVTPKYELAQITRLSTSYFSAAFRASFGTSPHDYICRRRIDHAKQLMLTTDTPLCEIALDCGFADQSHLCRVFRRITGQTPAAWRRNRRIG